MNKNHSRCTEPHQKWENKIIKLFFFSFYIPFQVLSVKLTLAFPYTYVWYDFFFSPFCSVYWFFSSELIWQIDFRIALNEIMINVTEAKKRRKNISHAWTTKTLWIWRAEGFDKTHRQDICHIINRWTNWPNGCSKRYVNDYYYIFVVKL